MRITGVYNTNRPARDVSAYNEYGTSKYGVYVTNYSLGIKNSKVQWKNETEDDDDMTTS